MDKAHNVTGIFEKDWEKVRKGTTSALTLLENNLSFFNRQIGLVLLPTVKKLAQTASGLIQPITTFMNKHKALTSVIVHITAGFISLRIVSFIVGYALTFLFGGFNRLIIVLKGLRLALLLSGAAFRSFFRIGPLAFAGIAFAVYKNWELVREYLGKIWDTAEPHWLRFKAVLDEYGITDKIISGWNFVKNFFENIWSISEPYWLKFKALMDEWGVTGPVMSAWNAVRELFSSIWSFVEPHWNKFKLLLQDYAVTDKITAAWTTVRDFFSNIWSVATPHWNAFIAKIRELNIADKIMAAWTKLKTFFTGIWDDITPKWDAFTTPLAKLWDGAKSSVSSVGKLFSSDETRPSFSSKLPPLNSEKSAPVTKNQSVNVAVNVNAAGAANPQEVARRVSREMESFNWGVLYDPVGEVP
jgi:hypothetical protein